MKSTSKQLTLISLTFVAFGLFFINVMVVEYTGWTQKLACYDKCETLGFEQCVFQRASEINSINQCNAFVSNDIIVLVLD